MDITIIIALCAVGFTILCALAKVIWDMSSMSTKLDLIMNNHLPHIEEWIKRLENKIDGKK